VPQASEALGVSGTADGTSGESDEMEGGELPEWAEDPRSSEEEPVVPADGTSQPQYTLKTFASGRVRFMTPPELFTSFGPERDE
jgi:hypothetical protein